MHVQKFGSPDRRATTTSVASPRGEAETGQLLSHRKNQDY